VVLLFFSAEFALLDNTFIIDEPPNALYVPFLNQIKQIAAPRLIICQQSSHPNWKDLENVMSGTSVLLYFFLVTGKFHGSALVEILEETEMKEKLAVRQQETHEVILHEGVKFAITWPEGLIFWAIGQTSIKAKKFSHHYVAFSKFFFFLVVILL